MKVGTKLFLMSAGTAIIILVVGVISLVSLSSLISSNQQVSHERDVLQELNMLMFNISDCVSAQRGYIISGKKPFLDAYEQLVVSTRESVDRIENLVKDNPEQLGRINDLRGTVKERLESLETTCQLFRAKGSEAAFERIRNGKSLLFRVELHRKIEAMKQTELVLLQKRDQQAKRNAVSAELTVFAGMALAVAFVAVSNFLFGATILTCVKQLITASENIKYGRFDLSANTNSNDEFADLAAAFNSLGQQLLISSRKLKDQKAALEAQTAAIAQLQTKADSLEGKLATVTELTESESRGVASFKLQLAGLDDWLTKLSDMSTTFQDLERTNQSYVQRLTIFNEGASKNASSLQSELDFRQEDQIAIAGNFVARLDKLTELNQSVEKLISGVELVTLTAEMELARGGVPDKSLHIFISTLKEKTNEARVAREHVRNHILDVKAATSEVLERYKDASAKLHNSRHSAAQISHELEKQTEVCHELRILFQDSTVQKYAHFIDQKKVFTKDLNNDIERRDMLARHLTEIVATTGSNFQSGIERKEEDSN